MPYNCINKAFFLFFNGNEAHLTDWLINNTLIPLRTKQERPKDRYWVPAAWDGK